jgi:polyisoprenoid-binding protein YceI
MNKKISISIVVLLAVLNIGLAQKQAKLLKSASSVTIKGTSTLHDWEEKVNQFECELVLDATANKLVSIQKGQFKCNVKSIESGNSMMNSKTYEALKYKTSPEIHFTLKSVEQLSVSGNKYSCNIIGDATIAGVTRQITIPASGTVQNNNIIIKGTTSINMPDFAIVPPTAMMGSIKTGKVATVSFSLSFVY